MLTLLPIAGAAQQATDISKPTRTRVTENKKGDQQKTTKGKEVKNNAKSTDKKTTAKTDDKKTTAKTDDKKTTTKTDDKKAAGKTDDKKAATKTDDKKAAGKADDKKPVTKTDDKKGPAKVDDKKGDQKEENKPEAKPIQQNTAPAPNPADEPYNGIDVSKHQATINWNEIKKNPKVQYVYIKATEGSTIIDNSYRRNIEEARKAGLKVGSYHYLSTQTSISTQFKNFATTALREEQDLLPMIDVEVCRPWSSQQLRDSLMVFVKMVEDYYGCKPLIYTYEKFYKENLGKVFADYPLFIAKYPKVPNDQPSIGGTKWIMWQFTDRGRIKGINGNVDLSRFNTGCSLNDIIYRPAKGKPKMSIKDAVDRNKPKPAKVTLTEQPKTKEQSAQSAKAKEAEEKKQAADKKKQQEVDKKKQEVEKKKQDTEKKKQETDKKKQEADKKKKQETERRKQEADKKKQQEDEAKAKRKADAKKAREQKAKSTSTGKTASLISSSSSKLTQSQRNDSIRNAQNAGRKINKSSADND